MSKANGANGHKEEPSPYWIKRYRPGQGESFEVGFPVFDTSAASVLLSCARSWS